MANLEKEVDVKEIENKLESYADCEALTVELTRFGEGMFAEVRRHAERLDGKLTSLLGWTGAMLALLLGRGHTEQTPWYVAVMLAGATFLGLLAAGIAWYGLRPQKICLPSERDWFKEELFNHPSKLRRYHLMSFLTAHQSAHRVNHRKEQTLKCTAVLFTCSVVVTGSALISTLLPWRFLRPLVHALNSQLRFLWW